MATTGELESVLVHSVDNAPLSEPPRAHTRDDSRAEQGLEPSTEEMQSESSLRQRHLQGQSVNTPDRDGDSSATTGGLLAQASREESHQTLGK